MLLPSIHTRILYGTPYSDSGMTAQLALLPRQTRQWHRPSVFIPQAIQTENNIKQSQFNLSTLIILSK